MICSALKNSTEFMKFPEEIKNHYEKWSDVLHTKIAFSLQDSDVHTKKHCEHVLFFCLLIAAKMKLSEDEINVLCCAAVFHDSRRQDDMFDVGHGRRAADYYHDFCCEKNLNFDKRVYLIIAFHDRDDDFGFTALSAEKDSENLTILYKIFKDADALDRFRLGPEALDAAYLRTKAAKSLYAKAKKISSDF